MEKDKKNEFKQFTEEDIEKIFGGSAVQVNGTSSSTENQSQSTERMQLQERYTASSDNLT
ncbi:ComC/BlpC family leader-containing pheromone/bacteriocin [Bacteroides acidifaciens]|uniref:ComC/BlpC family leader-containing pheromone/bacteriocin n=1 Tax=Bacteroides acidifaciens TaxID=85831 RepID=UPI002558011B|nr:ComC/BlpC family leader-containing pheromone/bacteriocin [Bacteroides acidifaciens]